MINRKLLLLAIFFISVLTISAVNASDNSTEVIVNLDETTEEVVNVENDNSIEENNLKNDSGDAVSLSEKDDSDDVLSISDDDEILKSSPPYSAYSVSVSDTTISASTGGSIVVKINSLASSSYSYRYDFYLRIYDSNGNQKFSENYYSSSSKTSITKTVSANEFSAGVYTIKIVNYADDRVMDTATLTVRDYNYPPSSAYSASVGDTVIDRSNGGSISVSIHPTSSSLYTYKYYLYLRIYDSNGNQVKSTTYYSSSYSSSVTKTYSISSNSLSGGIYTVKLENRFDGNVMDTATLTVRDYTYPPSSVYSASVGDNVIDRSKGGSISVSIYPTSSSLYTYKYYLYLRIYDSNGNQVKSTNYYSSSYSSSVTKTYSISSNSLSTGIYTVKLENRFDGNVMDTAKLTVINDGPEYDEYSASVEDTNITYQNGGSISVTINPTTSYSYTYKYYLNLRIYDSNGNLKKSTSFYSSSGSSKVTETYQINSYGLSTGIYTIKLENERDGKVMDTAKLTVVNDGPEYDDYSASVEDTRILSQDGGSISVTINPATDYSHTYNYFINLRIYDSNGNQRGSTSFYDNSYDSTVTKTYTISSNSLSAGTYTVKLENERDGKIMDTALLTVADNLFNLDPEDDYYVDESVIINYNIDSKATGTLCVYLNDKFEKYVSVGNQIDLGYLKEGEYKVKVEYLGCNLVPSRTDVCTVYVNKYYCYYDIEYDLTAGNEGKIIFEFEDINTGNINVYFPDFPNKKSFDAQITNGKATITVPGVPVGYYDFILNYTTNDLYYPDYSSIYVDYREAPITLYIPEVTWGQNLNIEPVVPKGASGEFEIYIDNVLVHTMNVSNKYSFTALKGGEHTIKIKYSGDDYYTDNETSQKFTIKRFDTPITFNTTVIANPYSTLQVNLNKETNGYIQVKVNDETYSGYVKNGTFEFTRNMYSGTYSVVIDYAGDDKYNPVKVAKDLTATAKDPNIKLDINNFIGIPSSATVRPTFASGASGSYRLYVDNSYKSFLSVGSSYSISQPAIGKHIVKIIYNGDRYFNSANITSTFRVFKINPIVTQDMKIVHGSQIYFQAKFYDEQGALLTDTYVQFNVNGTDYPVLTDENGIASLNVELDVGVYNVKSISPLDESKSNKLTVFDSIISENTVIEYSSGEYFKAKFLDKNAIPITKTGMMFTLDGLVQPMEFTDENGVAILNKTLSLGTHTIKTLNDVTKQEMINTVIVVSNIRAIMTVNNINDINYGQKAVLTVNIGSSYLNSDVEIRIRNDKGYDEIFKQKSSPTVVKEFTGLNAGNYIVDVKFTSRTDGLVLKTNKTFKVSTVPSTMSYSVHDAAYGDPVQIDVNVLNTNGSVTVKVGTRSSTANLLNGKNTFYISGLSVGVYDVEIHFKGDTNYQSLLKTDKVAVYKNLNAVFDSTVIVYDSSYFGEGDSDGVIYIYNYNEVEDSKLVLYIDGKVVPIEDMYYSSDEYDRDCFILTFDTSKLSEGRHNYEIRHFDDKNNIIAYASHEFNAINWKNYGGHNFESILYKNSTYIPSKNIKWNVKIIGTIDGYKYHLSTFNLNGVEYTLIQGLGYSMAHSPVFTVFNPNEYTFYDNNYYKVDDGLITEVINSYETVDGVYYKLAGRFTDSDKPYYRVINNKCYKLDGFYSIATYGVDYIVKNGIYYTRNGEVIDVYDFEDTVFEVIDGSLYEVEDNFYENRLHTSYPDDLININGELHPLIYSKFNPVSQDYDRKYTVVDSSLYSVVNNALGSKISLGQNIESYVSISIDKSSANVKLPKGVTGKLTLSLAGKVYITYPNSNGVALFAYPQLSPGTYSYTLNYEGSEKYTSFTKSGSFSVPAPAKPAKKITLKLKKVKVKKSAKKLVIKATLKINGKSVKNQKIKFKFNKKSFKARTNKKGVAKITVKKSLLKKLKVGKKVKYQAKYGKIVVKKTVKVKK